MNIFQAMQRHGHEELVFWYDQTSGLKAIVALHDTRLGPALGGCRMWPYPDEDDAIEDALRLSRGMTFKNAAMGLDLGGGKAVIWADPGQDKSEALWRSFGRLVKSLNGRYITAEDVGVSADDMEFVARESTFVGGLKDKGGDPAPATAMGVLAGIEACLTVVFGQNDLHGRHVAIQGLGHVGSRLANLLRKRGALLTVSDLDVSRGQAIARDVMATWVDSHDIYDVPCDVFSPCALGGVLNDDTIPRLRCRIVAGSANNQLARADHGRALKDRGILYAPDYIINGGGVINVAEGLRPGGYQEGSALARVRDLGKQIRDVIQIAERDDIATNEAADRLALMRLDQMTRIRLPYIPE